MTASSPLRTRRAARGGTALHVLRHYGTDLLVYRAVPGPCRHRRGTVGVAPGHRAGTGAAIPARRRRPAGRRARRPAARRPRSARSASVEWLLLQQHANTSTAGTALRGPPLRLRQADRSLAVLSVAAEIVALLRFLAGMLRLAGRVTVGPDGLDTATRRLSAASRRWTATATCGGEDIARQRMRVPAPPGGSGFRAFRGGSWMGRAAPDEIRRLRCDSAHASLCAQ